MTIEEAKQLECNLLNDITKLLQDFEKMTGLRVVALEQREFSEVRLLRITSALG